MGTNERVVVLNEMDNTGLFLKATLPYGDVNQKKNYTYNIFGTPKEITKPLGQTTTYAYSNAAYKTNGSATYLQKTSKVVSPDGKETWSYEDRMGRVIKEVEKSTSKIRTTQYEYTPLGQVAKVVVSGDGASQTTQYKYDGQGNLIYLKDSEGVVNSYVYNHLGQVISSYTNGQLQKQTKYNEAGLTLSKTNAASQKETYQYSNTGLLDKYTDNNVQSQQYSYTPYDEIKRLSIKNTTGSEIYWKEFTYDQATRLITNLKNSDSESLDYHYDQCKRLDQQTLANRLYKLNYDNIDRLEKLTYPEQKEVSYSYDNLNRIKTVTYPDMGVVSYNYQTNVNEQTSTLTYPNGIVQERKVNSFGEIVEYKQTSTNNLSNWNETFKSDVFSNIKEISRNGATHSFSYDGLNRIMNEQTPKGSKAYTYDGKGNRETAVGELASLNLDSENFTYNAENMLKTYTSSNGTNASYTYYGDGLRATKTVNGTKTRFVNLGGHVIEELDSNGNVKARNVWGDELLFRQ